MAIQNVTSKQILLGCYLKRFSCNFGFNNSATTVECELIEGNPNNAEHVSDGATGFISGLAIPGNVTGITVGAFNFKGIIQSWRKSSGPQGTSYTVRMADPRIALDNVPVIMGLGVSDLTGPTVKNVIDAFKFYSNPLDLGITQNGTLFNNVKAVLENEIIDLYNHKFSFSFDLGFTSATGTTSANGIPPWYRLKSNVMSVSQICQQISNDFNLDYYAYIDPSTYNATSGVTNTIQITSIKRTQNNTSTEVDDFVSNGRASGILISYERGQELRTDPIGSVINGAKKTAWVGVSSASGQSNPNILPYWGRTSDGSLLLSPSGNLSPVGVVLLDHLAGTNVDSILNTSDFQISYYKDTIVRTDTVNTYPPTLTVNRTTAYTTGYYPYVTTLQAALYSQEAWEAVMYQLHPAQAIRIGINEQIIRSPTEIRVQNSGTVKQAIDFQKISPSGRGNRNPYNANLIADIYQATRNAAETYWGKQFVVNMAQLDSTFTSNWLTDGTFSSVDAFPHIEYTPVEAAWSESGTSMPYSVTNHTQLVSCDNPNFKDNQGKLKAFVSFINYNFYDGTRAFPYMIDTSILPPQSYFLEKSTNKICFPIQCQVYEKYPTYAIITINQPVQAVMEGSGYTDRQPFYDFLLWWGFTQNEIVNGQLINHFSDGFNFGLAPLRPIFLDSSVGNYGVHIPVEFETKNYGPWIAYSSRPGPIAISNDADFAPWTFGSNSNMDTAGNQTIAKYHGSSDVIDSAQITMAGLPTYNIGQTIGNNSNINSISFQYGPDGLTTTYGIATFAFPGGRTNKILQDRITNVYNKTNYDNRQIENIDKQTGFDAAYGYYLGRIPVVQAKGKPDATNRHINYIIGTIDRDV